MPKIINTVLFAFLLIGFTSGCSITRNVSPVASSANISTIYVQKNPKVQMDGLHPEIVDQLKALGFSVETFEAARPAQAHYWMSYTANWQWDMAMYLTYFNATLMEDDKALGSVVYDATRGGGNMGKFGKTAEKIRPLMVELFQNVKKPNPSATPMGK